MPDSGMSCCNSYYCWFENYFKINILVDVLKILGLVSIPCKSMLTWKTFSVQIPDLSSPGSYYQHHTKTIPQLPDTQNPKVILSVLSIEIFNIGSYFMSSVEYLLFENSLILHICTPEEDRCRSGRHVMAIHKTCFCCWIESAKNWARLQ